MQIRKRIRIRLITLMRRSIRGYGFWFLFNADPDPDFYLMRIGSTFHPDVDPSSDLASKKRLIALKKHSNRLIFHTFWLVICKLMRADPDHNFYLMRIRIFIWCGCGSRLPGYQNDAYRWGSWSSTLFTACAVKNRREKVNNPVLSVKKPPRSNCSVSESSLEAGSPYLWKRPSGRISWPNHAPSSHRSQTDQTF